MHATNGTYGETTSTNLRVTNIKIGRSLAIHRTSILCTYPDVQVGHIN